MFLREQHYHLETRLKWIIWARALFLGVMLLGATGFNLFFEEIVGRGEIGLVGAGILFSFFSRFALWFSVLDFQKRILAWSQVVFDALFASGLIYLTGGFFSSFISIYGMVILAAAILLFTRGASIAAMIGAASYVLVSILGLESLSLWMDAQVLVRLLFVPSSLILVGALVAILFRNREDLVKRLEETHLDLEESHQLNSAILEQIPEGVILVNQEAKLIFSNPKARELFGDLLSQENLKETELKSILNDQDFQRLDWVVRGVTRNLQLQALSLGSQGRLIVIQDRTQIEELEKQIQLKDRLATVGQLAAGLAHEIKNPLASLSGSIQLMKRDLSPDSAQDRLMQIVLRETDRLDELLVNFLNYAKPSRLQLKSFHLGELVREIKSLFELKRESPVKSLVLSLKETGDLNLIADSSALRQVVWNLLRNAEAAMISGGEIAIELDGSQSGRVLMLVRDSGKGMSEETQKRIFEPFYTERSQGIGLGLALVYQILEGHQAKLQLKSKLGQGTEIRMEFLRKGPAIEEQREFSAA
ncbi:MAG: PAS domain-containing protein [Bradymonadales bacterium]|nr:MAG: PAS domain-containing protein [Bradymonadales bacterium]